MRQTKKLQKNYSKLRFLVEGFYAIQDLRIKSSNRLWALEEMGFPKTTCKYYKQGMEIHLKEAEKWLYGEIQKELKTSLVWNRWLKGIKGIGPALAGGLIGWIGDIGRFPTISALYSYCGLAVDSEGKAVRRKRGSPTKFHTKLQMHCWKIGKQFVKQGGEYRKFYDKSKEKYNKKYPKESAGHRDAMARRKTVKLFLAHLWVRWRELEGLPVESPYPVEKLGHHYIPPFAK